MKIGGLNISFTLKTTSANTEKDIQISKLIEKFKNISQVKSPSPFKGLKAAYKSGKKITKPLIKRMGADNTKISSAKFHNTWGKEGASQKRKADALGELFNI